MPIYPIVGDDAAAIKKIKTKCIGNHLGYIGRMLHNAFVNCFIDYQNIDILPVQIV